MAEQTTGRKRAKYRVASSRQQVRKRRRSRRGLYFILMGLVIAGVLLVLCNTVFFDLKNVVVEGDSPYTETDIRTAADLTDESSLWRLNTKQTAERISALLPEAEQVTAVKRYPDTLVVTVMQPVIRAAVPMNGRYAVISGKGRLLDWENELPEGMIEYVGLEEAVFDDAGFLTGGEERLEQLNTIYAAVLDSGISGIVRIEIGSTTQNYLYYTDRLKVRLGTAQSLEDKLLFLKKFIAEDLWEGETGTVDLTDARKLVFNPDDGDTSEETASSETQSAETSPQE